MSCFHVKNSVNFFWGGGGGGGGGVTLRTLLIAALNFSEFTIFAKIWTCKNFHQIFFPPLNDSFLRCERLYFFFVTLHGTFHSTIAKITFLVALLIRFSDFRYAYCECAHTKL